MCPSRKLDTSGGTSRPLRIQSSSSGGACGSSGLLSTPATLGAFTGGDVSAVGVCGAAGFVGASPTIALPSLREVSLDSATALLSGGDTTRPGLPGPITKYQPAAPIPTSTIANAAISGPA